MSAMGTGSMLVVQGSSVSMQACGGAAQGEPGRTGALSRLPSPQPCLCSCCPHHPPPLPSTALVSQHPRYPSPLLLPALPPVLLSPNKPGTQVCRGSSLLSTYAL